MAIVRAFNLVLGAGPQGGDYVVVPGAPEEVNHIPYNKTVKACWYNAVDNLDNFGGFETIKFDPTIGGINLTLKASNNALLRVYVYVEV